VFRQNRQQSHMYQAFFQSKEFLSH